MSRKTRKLIWAAPLMAVFAVIGALAMFAAQTPTGAQAQDAQEMLGPPQSLMATPDGRNVIELQWMAPATSPEAVTAYRIDKSKDGTVWMELVPASAGLQDTFYDHTGLDPGDTMYYRVFAVYGTKKGEGEPSETASATTDAATAPGKPTGLSLAGGTPSDVSGIAVTWVAPSDDGGSPITGYKIERLKDGDDTWMTAKADTGTTALTYQDMGLRSSTQYHYRVSAINKVGTGMPSDSEDATTGESTTAPASPTGLTAQGTNSAVTLHWLAPGDPGGDPVSGYKLERSVDSTSGTPDWTVIPTTGIRTSHFVGGAFSSAELPWHYRVTPMSAEAGDGLPTSALIVGPPDPATHGPAQSLRARSDTPLKIKVSWRAATGSSADTSTAYRVDYSTDGRIWKAATGTDTGTGTVTTTFDATSQRFIYEDTGLKIGEKRYYRVIAITGSVLHQVTNVVSGTAGTTDKPGKPTGLEFTTTPPTANTITLAWVAPTDTTGGSPITGYKIERSPNGTSWTTIVANTGLTDDITVDCVAATPCTYADKNLPANTQYYYRVSTINAGRTGDASATANTKTAAASALGLPTGLVALDRGTSVDLYWVSPGDADGAPVTGYKIEVSVNGGTTWTTVVANTMSRVTMYTHTGLTTLTGDNKRMYRVTAISSVGSSAPSMSDTAGPGGMVNTDPVANDMTIDPVTVMVGMSSDAMDVSGYFSDADGDDLTYSAGSSDEMVATAAIPDGSNMLTITGVAEGTATVTVTASDGMGGTDATRTIMVTVEAANAAPDAPVSLSATAVSDTQIDLSWDAPANAGSSAITHYIIERRYDGDMMGDIPSDGYSGTDGANRSFAFSNAMEWWETLNCKGMLAAAGSDETPAAEGEEKSADEMMYCGHFLNTEPSNVTDSAHELSDDAKAAVEALFAKRYVITDDTMTMYSDEGLMPDTAYTYRVSAVNSFGRSSWSAADTATTEMALMAPSIVSTNPVGSGLVTVTWTSVDGAAGYTILAINLADSSDYETEPINNPAMTTTQIAQINDLTQGVEYLIFVAAFDADGFELSEFVKITAE